ncbi:hypothetical protein FFLO_01118 [Filobasidium floriforme]|uniref:Uncharacterized protein n=1 Tax=Filobasidium floriforme TaxID=5210 RepID=A0A8K0JRS4_9TREE|nr:hypothetical protein FFLO_01118 [Filobasidium floriforme]
MFIARNAIRTLKRNNPNVTTLRTFHTSLTNLNKMSEETKQQIKTAFPELLNIAKQKTSLPGREKDMTPIAKHTELEVWTNEGEPEIYDYKGSNKLKGKAAILTGADSGIGRATALAFHREGAVVTISYLAEEEEDAQAVKKQIESEGGQCLCVPGDLMKDETCESVVKKHMEKYGHLEILVNNASKQIKCKDIVDIDLDNVRSTFHSNIVQMIAMAKFCVPHMKAGASIVNDASVTAFKGSPAMVDYSSTKGAIVSFTRALAGQLAPKGIRVNAVAPGPIYTPLQPASREAEEMEDWTVGGVPLRGRAGQPSEIVSSRVFLASNECSNIITGNIIHANLGQYFA